MFGFQLLHEGLRSDARRDVRDVVRPARLRNERLDPTDRLGVGIGTNDSRCGAAAPLKRVLNHPGIEAGRCLPLHRFVHDGVAAVDRLRLVPDDRHGDDRGRLRALECQNGHPNFLRVSVTHSERSRGSFVPLDGAAGSVATPPARSRTRLAAATLTTSIWAAGPMTTPAASRPDQEHTTNHETPRDHQASLAERAVEDARWRGAERDAKRELTTTGRHIVGDDTEQAQCAEHDRQQRKSAERGRQHTARRHARRRGEHLLPSTAGRRAARPGYQWATTSRKTAPTSACGRLVRTTRTPPREGNWQKD